MQVMKRFGFFFLSWLLGVLLFGFAVTFALTKITDSPDVIKQTLAESAVYDQIITEALQIETKQPTAAVSELEREAIKKAALETLPPATLQQWTETIIDSFYQWLEGNAPRPDFVIDLGPTKDALIINVANQAVARLEALPLCTPQQNLELSRRGTLDAFSIPCRPPLNIAAERDRLISELRQSNEVLPDTVITADDLKSQPGTQRIFEDSPVPFIFQWSKKAPVLFLVLAVLVSLGCILLANDRINGVRAVGRIAAGSGLFLVVATLLFSYFFNDMNQPERLSGWALGIEHNDLQIALLSAVRKLFDQLRNRLLFVSATYVTLGFGIWLFLRHRHQHTHSSP